MNSLTLLSPGVLCRLACFWLVPQRKNQSVDVNPYWFKEHFSGVAKSFLLELFQAMNKGNHDNSDIMTDYFDVGWYVDVNIGKWDKPYIVE